MEKRHYSVLVIDDDDAMREYVRFILEKDGFRVFEARDGNQGVVIAGENPPDCIITDLVMPDKEGIETIQEIKSLFPKCGIIAMSGAANSETYLSMAHCLGAHAVIQKPFNRVQLQKAVQSTMDHVK